MQAMRSSQILGSNELFPMQGGQEGCGNCGCFQRQAYHQRWQVIGQASQRADAGGTRGGLGEMDGKSWVPQPQPPARDADIKAGATTWAKQEVLARQAMDWAGTAQAAKREGSPTPSLGFPAGEEPAASSVSNIVRNTIVGGLMEAKREEEISLSPAAPTDEEEETEGPTVQQPRPCSREAGCPLGVCVSGSGSGPGGGCESGVYVRCGCGCGASERWEWQQQGQ